MSWFPRFADNPLTAPPQHDHTSLEVALGNGDTVTIAATDLLSLPQREQVSDFHCVTTWSRSGLRWSGVAMTDVWHEIIEPLAGDDADVPYVVARGADRYRISFRREDVLAPDAMIATMLDGEPLDARHGAPMRLVCPSQYGYKSLKHLTRLELHLTAPPLGSKEHLRARVDLEERHTRIPGRLLRWPYRLLVPATAAFAERSARR